MYLKASMCIILAVAIHSRHKTHSTNFGIDDICRFAFGGSISEVHK